MKKRVVFKLVGVGISFVLSIWLAWGEKQEIQDDFLPNNVILISSDSLETLNWEATVDSLEFLNIIEKYGIDTIYVRQSIGAIYFIARVIIVYDEKITIDNSYYYLLRSTHFINLHKDFERVDGKFKILYTRRGAAFWTWQILLLLVTCFVSFRYSKEKKKLFTFQKNTIKTVENINKILADLSTKITDLANWEFLQTNYLSIAGGAAGSGFYQIMDLTNAVSGLLYPVIGRKLFFKSVIEFFAEISENILEMSRDENNLKEGASKYISQVARLREWINAERITDADEEKFIKELGNIRKELK